MDNDSMTNEQTEKVLQFQDLTRIEDINVCRDVLIRHQWDLEVAIQEQLNIREGRPSMYAANTSDDRPLQVVNDRYLQHVFSKAAAPEGAVGGFFGRPSLTGVITYIFQLCYNTFSSILTTFLSFFRNDERIVTDPLGDVVTFIHNYQERYPVHPVFYQGTYAQALNDAKRELRFLLIYLHTENNTRTAEFCRNTLSNVGVIEYINQNMLFWGCDIASPEGYRVSHSINARNYPIMVVVGLRSNKMTIMGRLEGGSGPEELLRQLQTVVGDNDVYLSQARADRLERSMTQSLRQQQDEAYELSLRADQEKERLKKAERDEERRQRQLEEDEKMAEQTRKENIARMKIEMADEVPDEPDVANPNAVSVVFKLPNGARVERRFLSTNSLRDVYNYVFCHPASPDTFEITTNFPKRVLDTNGATSASVTLNEVGLRNREVLFVNDLDA